MKKSTKTNDPTAKHKSVLDMSADNVKMPVGSLIGFVPLALLAYFLHWGIVGVWLALVAFIGARLIVCGWRFLTPGWTAAAETPTLHAVSQ